MAKINVGELAKQFADGVWSRENDDVRARMTNEYLDFVFEHGWEGTDNITKELPDLLIDLDCDHRSKRKNDNGFIRLAEIFSDLAIRGQKMFVDQYIPDEVRTEEVREALRKAGAPHFAALCVKSDSPLKR